MTALGVGLDVVAEDLAWASSDDATALASGEDVDRQRQYAMSARDHATQALLEAAATPSQRRCAADLLAAAQALLDEEARRMSRGGVAGADSARSFTSATVLASPTLTVLE